MTYQAGMKKLSQFCVLHCISNPLPVSQSVLCLFISYLANQGLVCSTIKTYLSAVRYLHILNGLPEPRANPMPKLTLVERGIRRARASEESKRLRLPITPTILRQLKSLWAPTADEFDMVMMWAACCTAFFGFFRIGEITVDAQAASSTNCVAVGNIVVDDHLAPTVVKIHLRCSKTDQFGRGVDVYVGRTGDDLCPVAALLAYLARRRNDPGPLFRMSDGTLLTKGIFTARLREALSTLGYEASAYAGHSFRIGAATTAAERGIEDSVIKVLGRWDSSAYQLYVRSSRQLLAGIARRLVSNDVSTAGAEGRRQ